MFACGYSGVRVAAFFEKLAHFLAFTACDSARPRDDGHSFVRIFFADEIEGFDLVDHNALVLEM